MAIRRKGVEKENRREERRERGEKWPEKGKAELKRSRTDSGFKMMNCLPYF